MYRVKIKNSVIADLKQVKQEKLVLVFLEVVQTLRVDPCRPLHGMRKLQPYLLGRYSKRLGNQRRLIYVVDEAGQTVIIYAA